MLHYYSMYVTKMQLYNISATKLSFVVSTQLASILYHNLCYYRLQIPFRTSCRFSLMLIISKKQFNWVVPSVNHISKKQFGSCKQHPYNNSKKCVGVIVQYPWLNFMYLLIKKWLNQYIPMSIYIYILSLLTKS